MDKLKKNKYLYAGITALSVLTAFLLLVFIFFERKAVAEAFSAILGVLEPFLIGGVLAYLLAPLCNRLEKLLSKLLPKKDWNKKVSAGLSVAMCAIAALVIIVILIFLIVPATVRSVFSIIMSVPDYVKSFIDWSSDKLTDYPELKKYLNNFVDVAYDKFEDWTESRLMPSIQTLLNGVGSSITIFLNVLLNFVIGFIVSIYLLNSRRIFARQSKMLLYALFRPKAADMIYDEVKYADKVFSGFLRGKVLDSTIVGMICFIAMSIMGVEDAVLISVIVGVTNIIPFFGPFIGAVPSALLIFVHDPKQCLYFVIFIVILQQFDGNILGPKCMGNTTNLSAFWILFSILVFGGMFGFIGMIIGVPLFAVIYDISKKLIYHSLKKHGKEELIAPVSSENAEPPAEAEPEPETKNIPAENAEE